MKVILSVEVQDAKVNLDHYRDQGSEVTLAEAIRSDLDMYKRGELGLEEVIYGLGEDVELNLVGVAVDGQSFQLKELKGILADGEVLQVEGD